MLTKNLKRETYRRIATDLLKFPHPRFYFALSAIQVAIIFGAVLYVSWQNTFLSSDWWIINLRDIDDFAVNAGTEHLRRALVSGDWIRSFTFFQYAYGIGFWLLMVGLTLPLHILEVSELQIFFGRTLSLGAVLATSVVVALVGRRLYPQSKGLWLVALGLGFLTPMSLINGTKMHVNGWMTLFGAIAILLLVHPTKLSNKFLYTAAFFMGLAIGFKLTALVLLPVFLSTVFIRRRDVGTKQVLGSFLAVPTFGVLTGFPVFVLSPIKIDAANYVLSRLNLFSGLGSGVDGSAMERALDGLGFFGSPFILFGLVILLLLLSSKSHTKFGSTLGWGLPLSIALTFTFAWFGIMLVIDKPEIFLATYSLSISVFLPLGSFALAYASQKMWGQILLGWGLVFSNLLLSVQFPGTVLNAQNYAALASSPSVERKLNAAREIALLTDGLTGTTTVLMDASSVFPLSSIDEAVSMTFSFGNLTSYADAVERGGRFDFIVLDSESYYGMPDANEDAKRLSLREDGEIWSIDYELIYSNYGTLVYRLVSP